MNEIEKLKECIVEQLLPMQIYLFGSYANNTFTNESDLDFYIVVKDDVADIPTETARAIKRSEDKEWYDMAVMDLGVAKHLDKISSWQEAYMDKLNKEYIALLSGEENASDKFWKLEKRIREDKKDCGVQCAMSRSNQFYIMMSLLNEGAITLDDLDDFSDDLKDMMKHFASEK